MLRRKIVMLGVFVAMGIGTGGCMRSAALPPTSISRYPSNTPPVVKAPPRQPIPEIATNEWKPKVPEREWNSIVIHHTASTAGSVESIHEAHIKRKDKSGNPWLGIGYHFVIGNGSGMGDGEIQSTFRWREQMHGAHAGNTEHNQHGIGIVLVGNFEEAPPSPAQVQSVKRLISVMRKEYGIGSSDVIAHRDVKATACPGRLFPMAEVADDNRFNALTRTNNRRPETRITAASSIQPVGKF